MTVGKVAGITISAIVILPDDGILFNERLYNNSKYIHMNHNALIRITLPIAGADRGNKRDRTLNLSEYGKIQLIMLLQKYLRVWNTGKVFYRNEDNGLCVYNETTEDGKYKWKMEAFINDDIVGIIPAILTDPVDPQVEFEAARLMLNRTDNFVEITYAEMYTIMHILETLNLAGIANTTLLLYSQWLSSKVEGSALDSDTVSQLDSYLENVGSKINTAELPTMRDIMKGDKENGRKRTAAREQRNEND